MSISISNVLSNYTYGSGATLRPKLDKNDDGNWNKSELEAYTSAYKKATGTQIDAESLIRTYDADSDGVLSASEQESLLSDDALKLSTLTGVQESETSSSLPTSWLESMSSRGISSLLKYSIMSDQASTLFEGSSTGFSSSFMNLISQQSASKLYSIQAKYGDSSSWSLLPDSFA